MVSEMWAKHQSTCATIMSLHCNFHPRGRDKYQKRRKRRQAANQRNVLPSAPVYIHFALQSSLSQSGEGKTSRGQAGLATVSMLLPYPATTKPFFGSFVCTAIFSPLEGVAERKRKSSQGLDGWKAAELTHREKPRQPMNMNGSQASVFGLLHCDLLPLSGGGSLRFV